MKILEKIIPVNAFAVIITGLIVIYGWFTHNIQFIQIKSSWVPMQVNTALCFIFCGLSLLSFWKRYYILGASLISFPMVVALLTSLQYLFNIPFGIDQLFFNHYITILTSHRGRMAPNTALSFLIAGFGILSLHVSSLRKKPCFISSESGLFVIVLSLISLLGYFLGVETTFGWGKMTRMAVHTAFSFVFLGGAIIIAAYKKDCQVCLTTERKIKKVRTHGTIILIGIFLYLLLSGQQSQRLLINKSMALKLMMVEKIITAYFNERQILIEDISKEKNYKLPSFSILANHYIQKYSDILAIEWLDEKTVVKSVIPFGPNKEIMGLQLNQDETRNNLFKKLHTNNRFGMTPLLDLHQGPKGFLLLYYQETSPPSYLLFVLKFDHLLSMFKTLLDAGINFELKSLESLDQEFSYHSVFTFGGQQFKIVLSPTPLYWNRATSQTQLILGIAGLAFFIIFWLYSKAFILSRIKSEKLSEDKKLLEDLNFRLELIQKVDECINLAQNEKHLVASILRKISEHLNFEFSFFWKCEENQSRLTFYSAFSLHDQKSEFVQLSQKYIFAPGVDFPGRALANKAPTFCLDVGLDENCLRKGDANIFKLKGAFAIPVIFNNMVLGVLEFFSLDFIDTENKLLFGDLIKSCNKIALALDSYGVENKLKATRLHYEQLSGAIEKSAIVSMTDPQGKIIFINQAFEKISGYEKNEIIGSDHRILNSGFHDKDFFKEIWSKLNVGSIWSGEIKNKNKWGGHYWVYSTISPIKKGDGQIEKFISIAFDLTEEKRLIESSFKKSKLSSLGEMAGGIAHEINNPLAIIVGKTFQIKTLLTTPYVDIARIKEITENIESTTFRIAKIVKGLRNFARDGEGDPFESVLLERLIRETLDLCQIKFKENKIKLETRINLSSDSAIQCREVQISQVLLNLLNNSFDAIEGRDDPWITLEVLEFAESVTIKITDSGHGISSDIKNKLFQPFFTTKTIGKGTGLGLSISKGIIEQHHGSIFIDEQNKNTCFVIEIPKKQPAFKNVA